MNIFLVTLIIALSHFWITPQNGDPMTVTQNPGEVTLYETAYDAGVIGLLAHNDLAGKAFYQLEIGDQLYLDHRPYQVVNIIQYQTLNPYEFLDLQTGEILTGEEAIQAIYLDRPGALILQTCLEKFSDPDWGLTFWIAYPQPTRIAQ